MIPRRMDRHTIHKEHFKSMEYSDREAGNELNLVQSSATTFVYV